MNKHRIKIVRPTPEEEESIAAQLAEDPDTFEWTEEQWADAKPTQELFPDLATWARQRKADLEAGVIENVQITLSAEVVKWFKARTGEDRETGGTAWIALIEQILRAHVTTYTVTNLQPPHTPPGQQSPEAEKE